MARKSRFAPEVRERAGGLERTYTRSTWAGLVQGGAPAVLPPLGYARLRPAGRLQRVG